MVVCIHYRPCGFNYDYIYPIIRTGVPCFLLISGFFLFSTDRQKALEHCSRSIKRILKITIWCNLFYLLFMNIPKVLLFDDDFVFPTTFKGIFLAIFQGSDMCGHLWYLTAYIEALVVIYVLVRLRLERMFGFIVIAGIAAGQIFGKYSAFFEPLQAYNSLLYCRNFFTVSLPFFCLGWLLHKHCDAVLKLLKFRFAACLLALVLVLSYIEYHILHGSNLWGDYILTTVPLSLLMVICCLHRPDLGRGWMLETIGKKYSTNIYLYHMFVGWLLRKVLTHCPPPLFTVLVFVLTLVVVIAGGCIYKIFHSTFAESSEGKA